MILRNRLPHADWARDNIPKSEINLQYLLELMENYKVPQPYKGVYRIPNLSIENEGFITIVTNDNSGFLGIEYYAFQGEFLPFRWLSTLAVDR